MDTPPPWKTFPINYGRTPLFALSLEGKIFFVEESGGNSTIFESSLWNDSPPLVRSTSMEIHGIALPPHGARPYWWGQNPHTGIQMVACDNIFVTSHVRDSRFLVKDDNSGLITLFAVRSPEGGQELTRYTCSHASQEEVTSRVIHTSHEGETRLVDLLDGDPIHYTAKPGVFYYPVAFQWRRKVVTTGQWGPLLPRCLDQILFRTVGDDFEMLFSLDVENPTVVVVSSNHTSRVLHNTLICDGRLYRVDGNRISHHDDKTVFSLPAPVTHLHGVRSSDEHRVVMAEVSDGPHRRRLILGAQKGEGSFVTWGEVPSSLTTHDVEKGVTMRIVGDVFVLQTKRNPHVFFTARQATWGDANPLQKTTIPDWIRNPTVIPDLDGIPAIYGVRVEDDRLEIHRFEIP